MARKLLSASYCNVLALVLALCLSPSSGLATTLDEDDAACLETITRAVRKFALTMAKELHRCRETRSDPLATTCDATLPRLTKPRKRRDRAIARDCKTLDPVRVLGYTGCAEPACRDVDPSLTLAGYQACIACASEAAVARLYRATGNTCGNGFVDAGEACDGTSDPRCDSRCRIAAVCGNGTLEPREECDGSVMGNTCAQDGYQCVPPGFAKECTCVPPCALDPIPARVAFHTTGAGGDHCGCTLANASDVSCTGASKVADLECGTLLVGGGLSATPPSRTVGGSTIYGQLPVCAGDELFIGADPGEGPDPRKNCSTGVDDVGNPRCLFGPPLALVNSNASLSACVVNGLKDDLHGTINATSGHVSVTAALESMIYFTGDLVSGRCRGGLTPGKPCQRNYTAPRGDCGVCVGGTNAGNGCQDDATGVCVGGSKASQACTDGADCPGGSCEGNCPGGTCHGVCADDVTAECVGGSTAGAACTPPVCGTGSNLGVPCTSDTDCDDGLCGSTTTSVCTGGVNQGDFCTADTDCPGSSCSATDCPGGTCTAIGRPPVQPCPVCTDVRFNPISDGTSGTCDLGGNRGAPCSSTNSEGLTIDCLPDEDLALVDLPVTLSNLTTRQSAMVADDDGTFCNFGFCLGGERHGETCNNDAECSGGSCYRACQGGLDANGESLDGHPCQNHDDCTGLTQGVCGQPDPGAFIAGKAGNVTVRRIVESGQPAPPPLTVGAVKSSTLAAVFCIPHTSARAINSAHSVPGPGAISLEGALMVFGRCVGGPNDGEYCLGPGDCPAGACGESLR